MRCRAQRSCTLLASSPVSSSSSRVSVTPEVSIGAGSYATDSSSSCSTSPILLCRRSLPLPGTTGGGEARGRRSDTEGTERGRSAATGAGPSVSLRHPPAGRTQLRGQRKGGPMPALTLKVFISSPGDVGQERVVATHVLERIRGAFGGLVELEPILWEHEPLRATGHFQEQIPPPSESDIVVCILWSRLGTRPLQGAAPPAAGAGHRRLHPLVPARPPPAGSVRAGGRHALLLRDRMGVRGRGPGASPDRQAGPAGLPEDGRAAGRPQRPAG